MAFHCYTQYKITGRVQIQIKTPELLQLYKEWRTHELEVIHSTLIALLIAPDELFHDYHSPCLK